MRRIVIVDATEANRKLACTILGRMENVEVIAVPDRHNGLAEVIRGADLLVTEIDEKSGGLRLIKEIRAIVNLRGLPIIILTAMQIDGIEARQAQEARVNAILSKPYDPSALRLIAELVLDFRSPSEKGVTKEATGTVAFGLL
jgi:CheY-like chemotaxis protein